MPSSSKAHSGRQTQSGQSPLSQSPQNAVTNPTIARNGRKKGRSAASKVTGAIKTEDNFWDDTPFESPPQLAEQPDEPVDDETELDRHNVEPEDLDALGDLDSASENESTHRTEKWRTSLPIGTSRLAHPPANAPVAESPPVAHKGVDNGGPSTGTPPVSPPQRKVRPISFGGSSNVSRQPSSDMHHRQAPGSSAFMPPPLPHLPQPHFYGAPDIDLGFGDWPNHWMKEQTVQFTAFDQIPAPSNYPKSKSLPCLLIGTTGRLDVLSVKEEKLTQIGCLVGLSGDVIGAAILFGYVGQDIYGQPPPFIAVTIHGPKREAGNVADNHNDGSRDNQAVSPNPSQVRSTGPSGRSEYQTRVDVYSLTTQKCVLNLFLGQPTSGFPAFRGLPRSPPAPSGDISLHANGRFILVASGSSGEIFVFVASNDGFRCLTKLWTTIQSRETRKYSNSSNSTESDASPADPNRGQSPASLPLLTWSGRWLAVVPPGSSARPSINGVVPLDLLPDHIPELEMLHAPPRPATTCVIDSPDTESIINKVARGLAKEVVKGARWLGDQGLQTWNNYWNQSASPPQTSSPNSRFPPNQEPNYPPGTFPPTHGSETNASSEPDVITLFDLYNLERQNRWKRSPIPPVATFQPPGGCSFLSLSPTGLTMLTASRTGDIQHLWDLMQVSHTRVAALVSNSPASVDGEVQNHTPRVRQIARYVRLSSSSIVDAVWTGPVGDRFAMLTRNGTVHVFDVPQSAFQWPPPRRILKTPQSPSLSPSTTSEANPGSGVFASAMRFAGKTQPILTNLRGRAPSIGGTLGGMGSTGMGFASATGVRSGKAVAVGLSKSVGAATETVNHLRHAGENRVHLHALARNPRPRTVMWSVIRGEVVILALDSSLVRTFRTRKREVTVRQAQKIWVSIIDTRRSTEIRIPPMEQLSKAAPDYTTIWMLNDTTTEPQSLLHDSHPLSRAEIETNAPFQPFHSDNRVNLFIYTSTTPTGEGLSDRQIAAGKKSRRLKTAQETSGDTTPWVFGDEIPSKKITLRAAPDETEESDNFSTEQGSTIIRQAQTGTRSHTGHPDSDPIEQIVITTRRKKNKPQSDAMAATAAMGGTLSIDPYDPIVEDDGFFEDDCEVLDWAGDRV